MFGSRVSRLAAVLLISLTIVAGMAAPAGATPPNVDIVGSGAQATFSPTTLSGVAQPAVSCQTTFVALFTIVNTGKRSAYLTQNGVFVGKIPAGGTDNFCYSGFSIGTQFVIGLTSANHSKTYASTLTITLA